MAVVSIFGNNYFSDNFFDFLITAFKIKYLIEKKIESLKKSSVMFKIKQILHKSYIKQCLT